MSARLTGPERTALLSLARAAIVRCTGSAREPDPVERVLARMPRSPRLERSGACFVTLRRDGELRGCIGSVVAEEPLARNVVRNAEAAALADPRFVPVGAADLPALDIEISVLTPMRAVSSLDEIVLGRHGVQLEVGPRRSLFLPGVAEDQGWELVQLLEHLALKAGLPRTAWRHGRLAVFETESFGEASTGQAAEG